MDHTRHAPRILLRQDGGGLYNEGGAFVSTGTAFKQNSASIGVAIFHLSLAEKSLMTGLMLQGHDTNAVTVRNLGNLPFSCDYGYYMPLSGDYTGDLDGCAFLCPERYLSSASSPSLLSRPR